MRTEKYVTIFMQRCTKCLKQAAFPRLLSAEGCGFLKSVHDWKPQGSSLRTVSFRLGNGPPRAQETAGFIPAECQLQP